MYLLDDLKKSKEQIVRASGISAKDIDNFLYESYVPEHIINLANMNSKQTLVQDICALNITTKYKLILLDAIFNVDKPPTKEKLKVFKKYLQKHTFKPHHRTAISSFNKIVDVPTALDRYWNSLEKPEYKYFHRQYNKYRSNKTVTQL